MTEDDQPLLAVEGKDTKGVDHGRCVITALVQKIRRLRSSA